MEDRRTQKPRLSVVGHMSREALEREVTFLRGEVQRYKTELMQAHHDPAYGILTRSGVERRWRMLAEDKEARYAVIYGDINLLHKLNSDNGEPMMDIKITAALKAGITAAIKRVPMRSDDLPLNLDVGRWKSGDEIIWFVPLGDEEGVMRRIEQGFESVGMGIMLAAVPIEGSLLKAVEAAERVVKQKKRERGLEVR